MVLTCNGCKQEFSVLNPIGKKAYCMGCLNNIHKFILSRINPDKLRFISYLERDILIELYYFAIENNFRCEFQYEIGVTENGCALQQAAERDNYTFNCPHRFEDFDDCMALTCKFKYLNRYTKYILDFALFKDDMKIDLELDGFAFHKNKKEHDEKRNQFLFENGWTVIRYTYYEIMRNRDRVYEDINNIIKHKII